MHEEVLADRVQVTVGSLDEPDRVRPDDHVWTQDQLPWFEVNDQLPRYQQSSAAVPALGDGSFVTGHLTESPMNLWAARLFVRDIAVAKAFYAERLRLTLAADGSEHGDCVFRVGAVDLVVEAVDAGAPEDEQVLVGRHTGLSFGVSDIESKQRELSALGVEFQTPPEKQFWGGWLTTLLDPDGNELQLVQYPA